MNKYLLEKWCKWFDYCQANGLDDRLLRANIKICQFNEK